jgi:hypothetical protein
MQTGLTPGATWLALREEASTLRRRRHCTPAATTENRSTASGTAKKKERLSSIGCGSRSTAMRLVVLLQYGCFTMDGTLPGRSGRLHRVVTDESALTKLLSVTDSAKTHKSIAVGTNGPEHATRELDSSSSAPLSVSTQSGPIADPTQVKKRTFALGSNTFASPDAAHLPR